MKFPKMRSINKSTQVTSVFGGYNHNPVIGDGEWYEMQNMTSDNYPLLSPDVEGIEESLEFGIGGMISNNGLCYVKRKDSGEWFFVVAQHDENSGGLKERELQMDLDPGQKKLVSIGAFVIILPDKKWVNVAAVLDSNAEEIEKTGNIDAELSVEADSSGKATISFYPCTKAGERISFTASSSRLQTPADGDYWVDTAQTPPVMKQWFESSKMWMEEESYLCVWVEKTEGQMEPVFQKGDAIQAPLWTGTYETPSGSRFAYVFEDPVIQEVLHAERMYGYVVRGVAGYGSGQGNQSATGSPISWTRKMPDLDFVIESGNRLWGCKFGQTGHGFLNEIYASKLGDFKNWNSFQGVSTDSYRASIGADGPFTGAINYNGKPVFFKEECMVQVYGAYPAQYQVNTIVCNGIQPMCDESAAIVNNRLYYLSRNGVCMYDGSLPVSISAPLGRIAAFSAAGGAAADKYYIRIDAGTDSEATGCYVFDTGKGLWHKRDNRLRYYSKGCEHNGDLYMYFSGTDDSDPPQHHSLVYRIKGTGEAIGDRPVDRPPVEWMVESGNIGLTTPDSKYISRLDVRMSLAEGSEVAFYVKYDFEDEWIHLATITGTSLRSFDVPIRPKRCDTMRLRIEGTGDAKIYSITKIIEQGGDVH